MADKPIKDRKPRIKNFTEAEDNVLIPYIVEHHDLFFGPLSTTGSAIKVRQKHQAHVQSMVNA